MIYRIDPTTDRRWEPFVSAHPDSSIFHTTGWLEALRQTYGYRPVAYTTSPAAGELANGLVFCHVSSWLTGRRLVSLPFSDHCDPLTGKGDEMDGLYEELRRDQASQHWNYVEIRPRNNSLGRQSGMEPGKSYCFHVLDLRCSEKALYSNLHESCTRRKIRCAERAKLEYREGRSIELLKMFYELFVRMRKRQRIPPQPFSWFRNLSECLGPAMQVRSAFHGDRLVASIVTLQFGKTLVYKYGCSDSKFNNLGGMQWLFWKTIQEAKALGLHELDLGRSDWDNPGLTTFKDRLGGKRFALNYWQYPNAEAQSSLFGIFKRPAGWLVAHTPLPILVIVGRFLYRHIG